MIKPVSRFLVLTIFLFCAANIVLAEIVADPAHNIVKADNIVYKHSEQTVEAYGNVKILHENTYLEADRVFIDLKEKKLLVQGEAYVENLPRKLFAKSIVIDQAHDTASMDHAKLALNDSDIIVAKKLKQINKDEVEISQGSFSPCKACLHQKPLWQIHARQTKIDFKKKDITYRNATFQFAHLKLFYLPYFSHPMADAEAKSGILRPELYRGSLRVPLYYRIKPNMDLTYTPRISKKILIHELEYRHLLDIGEYSVNGSYGRSRVVTKGEQSSNKDKSLSRYYINFHGKFQYEDYAYGADFNQVSDKSYLKNYYGDSRTYLKSHAYLSKIHQDGYFYVDLQKYKGLRLQDNKSTDPQIMPNIIVQKDFEFENDWALDVNNKTLNYVEYGGKNISRNSLNLDLKRNYFLESGPIIDLSAANTLDSYYIKQSKQDNRVIKEKSAARNTPELKAGIRTPFYHYAANNAILIEPVISIVTGPKQQKNINKYYLIDSPNLDVNENNLFVKSRYSGVDFREDGTRLSYGVSASASNNDWYFSSILGQMIRSSSNIGNTRRHLVGKAQISYADSLDLYYRFQKNAKTLEMLRDEVSLYLHYNRFSLNNEYVALRNIRLTEGNTAYFREDDLMSNTIKQDTITASYRLTNEVTLFGDIRLDIAHKNKMRILSDTIGLTYSFDCISITGNIMNDYTYDLARNIRKTKSYTVKLGLKSINF